MNIQNRVTLIGFLGKDPDIKSFDNGGKISNVTIATDDSYKNKEGEKVQVTDWHNLVFRGGLVDVVEKYLRKGMRIAVEGKLKQRSYEKDGTTHYVTEIQVSDLLMLSKAEGASAQATSAPTLTAPPPDTDDIPF